MMSEKEIVAFLSGWDYFDKIELVPAIQEPNGPQLPSGTMLLRLVAFNHKSVAVHVIPEKLDLKTMKNIVNNIHMQLMVSVFEEYKSHWAAVKAQEEQGLSGPQGVVESGDDAPAEKTE